MAGLVVGTVQRAKRLKPGEYLVRRVEWYPMNRLMRWKQPGWESL